MSDSDVPRRISARRGFSLSFRGKTLLSLIDPAAQAERLVETLPPDGLERTLFLVPSPLYGYGLAKLLGRMGPESAALCVETEPRLLDLSGEALAPLLEPAQGEGLPRILLTGEAGTEGLCDLARRTWGPRRFRRVRTLRLTGGWQLDGDRYAALEAALEREIAGDWENALTLVKLGRRYVWNFIRNLAVVPRSRTIAGYMFGSAPVLVLGAGPSLDGLLGDLAARFPDLSPRNRPFRIIAVDTALRCLLARKIRPDLVAALECQHWNLRDFCGAGGEDIAVAMDLSALPATGEALGSPVLFFTPWTGLGLFGRLAEEGLLPPAVPALGSVGLSAAALALRIGGGKVLTGGLDFSFTLDRYHARAAPSSDEALRSSTRLRSPIRPGPAFREGISRFRAKDGSEVLGGGALKRYRDLFEREFSGEGRLRDTGGPGLPLGIPALGREEAFRLLEGDGAAPGEAPAGGASAGGGAAGGSAGLREKMKTFMERERGDLVRLRDILTGAAPPGNALEGLLDRADYLWAHFPECAGTGGRRPAPPSGVAPEVAPDGAGGAWESFLKRVRVEIDPFIRRWELALELCSGA